MGTIAFLILRFIFKYNTPGYDFVILCFLLSFDTLVLVQLLRLRRH